ncbi:C2H2-type zinc finger protein, partial [Methylicorpusculum sp.]|uniref:C2H2-type zinc finger protein n=1 Tax=Methylicorpusculum sp. TaxID=2713644 RepID=UPI002ABCAF58
NGGLTRHMTTHTKIKEFVCDICAEPFARQDTLEQHMQTHSEEKKFKCTQCNKRFARREQLQIHMNTHTGDRPYACDLCEKTFADPSSLSTHIKAHTGKNWYVCGYPGCPYKTPTKTHQTRHIQAKHQKPQELPMGQHITPEPAPARKKRTTTLTGQTIIAVYAAELTHKKQNILRDDPMLNTIAPDAEPIIQNNNADERATNPNPAATDNAITAIGAIATADYFTPHTCPAQETA